MQQGTMLYIVSATGYVFLAFLERPAPMRAWAGRFGLLTWTARRQDGAALVLAGPEARDPPVVLLRLRVSLGTRGAADRSSGQLNIAAISEVASVDGAGEEMTMRITTEERKELTLRATSWREFEMWFQVTQPPQSFPASTTRT
eukprot:1716835-Rhodomonas_salina.3